MWRRALVIGVLCESIAFAFLYFGQWEFFGPTDFAGETGLLLHLPGFWVARHLGGFGNWDWLIIVGLPLVMWIVTAWCVCVVFYILRKHRRPKIEHGPGENSVAGK